MHIAEEGKDTLCSAVARISQLASEGKFDEMLRTAYRFLRQDGVNGLQKFRAIHTVILRHPDRTAALPLIDEVRHELMHESAYVKAVLSFYEEGNAGYSIFTERLEGRDRSLAEEGRRFLGAHPIILEVSVATSLMRDSLSFEEAGEAIMAALGTRSPLSVVRMGDGEGRFVMPLDHYPSIEARSREIAKSLWFQEGALPSCDYWELLKNGYASADIVGVSPPFRVDLASRNALIGYVGVVYGNRFLRRLPEDARPQRRAANWLFAQMNDTFFRQLVQKAGEVHFIGPHPAMKAKLQEMGANTAHVFLTPSDGIVPSVVDRPHYPGVFEEICRLIRERAGGLWLVSAGSHAKIYCHQIRATGGVALDIGSLSDKWVGLETR